MSVVCWIHFGSVLSGDTPEPLSLGVDACIQEGANFSDIASASYDSLVENRETWSNFYDTMTEIELDSLSAAVGHAGGFAVLCGFLVRDILQQNHNSEMSKFNGTQDKSYYGPAWIELRNWNVSQSEDSLTHLPDVYDPASTECLPSISYDRLVSENQRNYTARNMLDTSAELASSIQIIMNRFESYLGHLCLGDILHVILEDFRKNGKQIKGNEWTADLLHLISSMPHLKYGLRNLYFCIVNNHQIRTGLEELLTALNRHLLNPNDSSRLQQLCHIHSVWRNHGTPNSVMEILLSKLSLTSNQLEQCYYLPNMTINVEHLTPDKRLRIQIALSMMKDYEEKEAKLTFQETLIEKHLTELLAQFLHDLSEKKLIQFRNPNQDYLRKGQWQYDCMMSLIKIFEKPLLTRYRRAWWDFLWPMGDSKTTRKPPQKIYSLFSGDQQILKNIQTSTDFENFVETNTITSLNTKPSSVEPSVTLTNISRQILRKTTLDELNSITTADSEQNQLTTKTGVGTKTTSEELHSSIDVISSQVVTLMGINSEIITSEATGSTVSVNQVSTSQTFSVIEPSTTTQPILESMSFSTVDQEYLAGTAEEAVLQPSQFAALSRLTETRETSPMITQNGSVTETPHFDDELHFPKIREMATATMFELISLPKPSPGEWTRRKNVSEEISEKALAISTTSAYSEKDMLVSANQSTVGTTTVSNLLKSLKIEAANSQTERINVTVTPSDSNTVSEEPENKIGTEQAEERRTPSLKTAKQEILANTKKGSMPKTTTQKSTIQKELALTTTAMSNTTVSQSTKTNLQNQVTTQTESTTFESTSTISFVKDNLRNWTQFTVNVSAETTATYSATVSGFEPGKRENQLPDDTESTEGKTLYPASTEATLWLYSSTDSRQDKLEENESTDTTKILPSVASKNSKNESKHLFENKSLGTTTTQQIHITSFNVSQETSMKLSPTISHKSNKYGRREVGQKNLGEGPVDEKELYLFTLFETVMKHDLGATTMDLAAGTLTQNSAVYLIRMTLYVLYGYNSVSPDFIIQDYIQRVKDKEEEEEDV